MAVLIYLKDLPRIFVSIISNRDWRKIKIRDEGQPVNLSQVDVIYKIMK
jgi:hypothetical protein